MSKKWIIHISIGAAVIAFTVVGVGFAKSKDNEIRGGTILLGKQVEADFPILAKLTPDQAVQKALETVYGKVLKTELENENGFLVYSVEVVAADKTIVDVKVDAGSGKILAMDRDQMDEEEHESDEHVADRDRED